MKTTLQRCREYCARFLLRAARLISAPSEGTGNDLQNSDIFRGLVGCFRHQPVTVHDLDADGRIVFANEMACAYFGVEMNTLLGWTPGDFDPGVKVISPESVEIFTDVGSYTFETTHRISTGETIPVEVTSNYFHHAGRRYSICMSRDLRPAREAEAQRLERERTLVEQEGMQRLTRFATGSSGFMYLRECRPDGSDLITYASPSSRDVLGVSCELLMQHAIHLFERVVSSDKERLAQVEEMSVRTLASFHEEYGYLHPEKGFRWLENHAIPERLENGTIVWHGHIHDITERRELEEALALSERNFRALAENAPDNIARYDLDGRILYANPVLEKTVGSPLSEQVGKRASELFPGNEVILEYERVLNRVMTSGVPAEYEIVSAFAGMSRPLNDLIRIAPEYDASGKICGAVAIGRDNTEHKRLEQMILQREAEFRTLAENSPDMIIRYDLDCRRTYVNQAFLRATGATAEEVVGKPITEIGWWSINCSAQEFEDQLKEVIKTGVPATIQLFGFVPATNAPRHTSALVVPEFDIGGKLTSLLAFVRDVTELVQLQIGIADRERQFRTLVENTPDVMIRYDKALRRVWVSNNYENVYGRPRGRVIGTRPTEAWGRPMMTPEAYEAHLQRVMETGVAENVELDWYNEDGEYVCQALRVVPELDAQGQVSSVLTLSRDVSEIKRASMRLLAREQEFRTLVEHSPDTICRYDLDCKRIYANPRMIDLFGVGSAWVLNKTPMEFPGGESSYVYEKHIRRVIASGEIIDFEMNWSNANGKNFCTHIRLSPEFGNDGEVIGVLSVGRDISEIDEYRRRVHHLAFYDSLTNLPNRALLNDRLGQTIADAEYHGHRFGLMLLDLDGFKEVNDTLGHATGDLMLAQVAERLQGCVRIYDTVARLGGDEFAILLPEVREDENLGMIASKILQALSEPYFLEGQEVFISVSIGIAVFPTDSSDIESLFRYADSAMYFAKRQGRNNYQFYSSELTARSSDRMALESELRRAAKRNEFELYYQPQMDIVSGRVVGAEALLRWNLKGVGMIPPDRFIPIAEETGLIVGIGEWVLRSACETAVRWNKHRKYPIKIAVNLSSRQFVRNDLLKTVSDILAETGCKPGWLGLEITESLLLGDGDEIRWILAEFDSMGLSIAIDDFGTGYSALGYLNRFPIKVLKIDRSFVRDITINRDRAELVKAIISMARSLRKTLVAEGVENDAQAAYLSNLGCHVVQGYLFGKPMPMGDFEETILKETLSATLESRQHVH